MVKKVQKNARKGENSQWDMDTVAIDVIKYGAPYLFFWLSPYLRRLTTVPDYANAYIAHS